MALAYRRPTHSIIHGKTIKRYSNESQQFFGAPTKGQRNEVHTQNTWHSLTHSLVRIVHTRTAINIHLSNRKQTKKDGKKCTVREQRAYIKLRCGCCYCCCFCAWFLLPFSYSLPIAISIIFFRIVIALLLEAQRWFMLFLWALCSRASVLVYHISYYSSLQTVCSRRALHTCVRFLFSFLVALQMGWLWFVMGWKINFRGQPFYFSICAFHFVYSLSISIRVFSLAHMVILFFDTAKFSHDWVTCMR